MTTMIRIVCVFHWIQLNTINPRRYEQPYFEVVAAFQTSVHQTVTYNRAVVTEQSSIIDLYTAIRFSKVSEEEAVRRMLLLLATFKVMLSTCFANVRFWSIWTPKHFEFSTIFKVINPLTYISKSSSKSNVEI